MHINNPKAGLKMVWERFKECYGSPEVIERALFNEIENFPKITNKDHQKLLVCIYPDYICVPYVSKTGLTLPSLNECNQIPDDKTESYPQSCTASPPSEVSVIRKKPIVFEVKRSKGQQR